MSIIITRSLSSKPVLELLLIVTVPGLDAIDLLKLSRRSSPGKAGLIELVVASLTLPSPCEEPLSPAAAREADIEASLGDDRAA